ncbi:MAG TPA: undecaprenyl-phosphate glucose phosphotransferase [bacterium]|nr:undecaprenyl-phosphate glucose phosphotransferase [bacterium]
MITDRERFRDSVRYVADLAVVLVAWLVAYPIRFDLIPLRIPHVPPFADYAWLGALALLIWTVVMRLRPLLPVSRAGGLQEMLFTGLQRHIFAFVTFLVLTMFVSAYKPSRIVFLIFLTLSSAGIVAVRLILFQANRRQIRRGEGLSRVLVVGTGELALKLVRRLRQRADLGLQVVGLLADKAEEVSQVLEDTPVLGTADQVQSVVEAQCIDRVFVALPMSAHERLRVVLQHLESEMVDVKVVPDLLDYVVLQSSVEDLDGLPIISLKQVPLSGWGAVAKRLFDFGFAATVLTLGSPVFLLLALLTKLTSPGPVFYKQARMGLDGRVFDIYKYRSMRVDAEEQSGAVWAVEGDPRRTRFGAFLRKTNLDEIPQFINVLRGEMSVVGPRPERPVFIEKFRNEIPKYMLRHKVKAGLTGWAQVKGWRGNTDLNRRIECDLYYIENWSFWFDLRIIWLTVFSRAGRKNAY